MAEYIELEITPIPPDTVSAVKADINAVVESALADAGESELLSGGQIRIEVEKTFPADLVVIVGIWLASNAALETYKGVIIPILQSRFSFKQKPPDKD